MNKKSIFIYLIILLIIISLFLSIKTFLNKNISQKEVSRHNSLESFIKDIKSEDNISHTLTQDKENIKEIQGKNIENINEKEDVKKETIKKEDTKKEKPKNIDYIILNGFLIAKYDLETKKYTIWNEIIDKEPVPIEVRPFEEDEDFLFTNYNIYYDNWTFQLEGKNIYSTEPKSKRNNALIKYLSPSGEYEAEYFPHIALTGDWDARIDGNFRKVEETEKDRNIIKNLLNENGLKNTPIVINDIFLLDLENDGKDEKIITATNRLDRRDTPYHYIDFKEELKGDIKLKYTEDIGLYDISILIKDDKIIPLYSYYSSNHYGYDTLDNLAKEIYNEEYDDKIEDIKSCFGVSRYLLYLYSYDGNVRLYNPYDFSQGDGLEYEGQEIFAILDIDNDKELEILAGSYVSYDNWRVLNTILIDNKDGEIKEYNIHHYN